MSDSDNTPFGFGRFVPGFDFLQNLAKGATTGVSAMPGLASWVAPTVSVEEIDKRIGELKSVQFWLEQNSRALAATVQALEVQKMTLATLENMNVAMGDFAGAFGATMSEAVSGKHRDKDKAAVAAPAPAPEAEKPQTHSARKQDAESKDTNAFASAAAGMVDPVQWWTSLTNQFQEIAANAMRDVAKHAANAPAAATAGSGVATDAFKAASDMATQFAEQGMKGAQEMTRSAMSATTARSKSASAKSAPAKKAPVKKAAPAKAAAKASKAKSPGR